MLQSQWDSGIMKQTQNWNYELPEQGQYQKVNRILIIPCFGNWNESIPKKIEIIIKH